MGRWRAEKFLCRLPDVVVENLDVLLFFHGASLLAEKHHQSIRFPPPCLTVEMVFLGLKASPFLRQIKDTLWPNNSIFVSSDHTREAVLGVTSYKVTDYGNNITFLGNEVK